MASDISTTNPVFYFSYATKDRSKRLTRFVHDLRHLVAERMGISDAQAVGFRDVENITVSDLWEEKLVDALQTSRVLVPNYSVNYFQSENCGREIQFFLMRAEMLNTTKKASPRHPMIVPALWSSEKELISNGFPPKPLGSLYYSLPNVPDYAEQGLRRIIDKDPKFYHLIVDALADLIVERAKKETLPVLSPQPKFGEVSSLFQPEETGMEGATQLDPHSDTKENTAQPETDTADFDFPSLVFRLVVARQLEVGDLKAFNPDNIDTAVKEWVHNEAVTKKDPRGKTKGQSTNDFDRLLSRISENKTNRRAVYTHVLAMLTEKQPGISPNPLWLSWFKIAHADKMESLEELLRDKA